MDILKKDPFWYSDKVVAYCRVSTNNQKFDRQIYEIENFAKERNAEIVEWFYEKISGITPLEKRPIFMKACKYCDEHGYTMIIAGIDRLTRDITLPIKFSTMEERGDFDIEMICDKVESGHVPIESLMISIVSNVELMKNILGDDNKSVKELNELILNERKRREIY